MTNFPKVSRFDDGEKPPETDYRDWNKSDTRIAGMALDDMSYVELTDWVEANFGPILEEISGPEVSVAQGVAYYRVYKPNKNPRLK